MPAHLETSAATTLRSARREASLAIPASVTRAPQVETSSDVAVSSTRAHRAASSGTRLPRRTAARTSGEREERLPGERDELVHADARRSRQAFELDRRASGAPGRSRTAHASTRRPH